MDKFLNEPNLQSNLSTHMNGAVRAGAVKQGVWRQEPSSRVCGGRSRHAWCVGTGDIMQGVWGEEQSCSVYVAGAVMQGVWGEEPSCRVCGDRSRHAGWCVGTGAVMHGGAWGQEPSCMEPSCMVVCGNRSRHAWWYVETGAVMQGVSADTSHKPTQNIGYCLVCHSNTH